MKSLLAAGALALGLSTVAASAMPVVSFDNAPGFTEVRFGCGPGWTPGPYGHCYAMSRPAFRACPPGMHLGPYGQRCWPNHRWRRDYY